MALFTLLLAGSLLGSASSQYLNATETSKVAQACNSLSSVYPDKVLFPNSTNYTTEATNYWDIRADLLPSCIFLPTETEEVVAAVKTVVASNAQFAIRGGGHMNFPGSNNIDKGVLIALNALDNLKVAADNATVELGPGLKWYDVNVALEPYDRLVIGGRMKTIGVPGLTLIGGFHYFNNKYGFAMDNVVSYDIILGNGTLVTANKTQNGDLFWALKGGSSNFGLVVKFVHKIYAIPKISTTIQLFNETELPAYFKGTVDLASLDEKNATAAGGIFTVTANMTTNVVSGSLLGVQEGVSNPPSQFVNFTAIPGTTKIHNVTTAKEWSSQLDSPYQMFRNSFAHYTILIKSPNASDVLYDMYKTWKAALDDVADVEGLYPTFVVNMIPKGAARVGLTNGIGNTWGLDDQYAGIIWQISTGWANAEDDLRMLAWSKGLTTSIHTSNKEKGIASDFIYMGDAADWQIEEVWNGYGQANIQKMKDIRTKYDPQGVFRRLNWGGFKLPY